MTEAPHACDVHLHGEDRDWHCVLGPEPHEKHQTIHGWTFTIKPGRPER